MYGLQGATPPGILLPCAIQSSNQILSHFSNTLGQFSAVTLELFSNTKPGRKGTIVLSK